MAISSRSSNERYRPETGAKEIGGIPPDRRNHLVPTAGDTPASFAASSLDEPLAIASQNRTISSRPATDGRPGDLIKPRIARTASSRLLTPIAEHLPLEMLRRSIESTQYTSLEFGKRCEKVGIRPSMGSVGDAYDNAMAESFFATLETELIDRERFETQREARFAVFDYIEAWYNPHRRHSSLEYLSPAAFEARFKTRDEHAVAA